MFKMKAYLARLTKHLDRKAPLSTKELLKERMKGRIYWASVIFAAMPVYRPSLKVGPRDIPVLMNPNPVLGNVAAWLKTQLMR